MMLLSRRLRLQFFLKFNRTRPFGALELKTNMIIDAYNTSEIARRYYLLKTGESLSREQARNRWKMTRNPDKKILNKVFTEVLKEQKAMI
jgi:hypothetical protein